MCDIFQALLGTRTVHKTAVEELNTYFTPKRNTVFERHLFRRVKQSTGETLDQFHVRLRKLASTYEFKNIEEELISQITEGTSSIRLCRNALHEAKVTLDKLIHMGKSLGNAESQAANVEGTAVSEQVKKLRVSEQKKGQVPNSDAKQHH